MIDADLAPGVHHIEPIAEVEIAKVSIEDRESPSRAIAAIGIACQEGMQAASRTLVETPPLTATH